MSGARAVDGRRRATTALRAFDTRDARRPALRCDDPAGRRRPADRRATAAEAARRARPGPRCSRSSASWPARARSPLDLRRRRDRRGRLGGARRALPGPRPGRPVGPLRPQRRLRRCRPRALADGDELAFIPPVSGGAARARTASADPGPRAAPGRFAGRSSAGAGRPARDARRRRGRGVPRPDPRDARARRRRARRPRRRRHAGRRVEALEYEAHESMADAASSADRRRDRRRGSASSGWRSSIAPATVPLGEVSIASSPCRRIGTRRSRRPATRSTRRRPARRSGRPSSSRDGHVWVGAPARTGPAEPTEEEHREGLRQRRHGGHRPGSATAIRRGAGRGLPGGRRSSWSARRTPRSRAPSPAARPRSLVNDSHGACST